MSRLRARTGLSKGDVHLWYASLDGFEASSMFLSTLSEDEQAKRGVFLRELEWKRFVVGRAMLRAILSCYLGIAPEEIRLAYNRHGKPSLGRPHQVGRVRFNLSHSNGLVLYALTLDSEIGVDLECISDVPGLQQIADRFLSKHERLLIQYLKGVWKKEAFFRIWARKEAILKAGGKGLSGFATMLGDSMNSTSAESLAGIGPNENRLGGLSVEELDLIPGFAAAVAVRGPIGRLVCQEWIRRVS